MSLIVAMMRQVCFAGKHKQQVNQGCEGGDIFDIYLGGSCGETGWREEIAIPIIKRYGLSFHNPHVTEWFNRLIPMQVAEREKCRLMLYVITSTTRSFSAMIEAAYYIGLGCRVILCLQMLPDDVVIGGETLTDSAVKDYNRGRAYLSDMASREGVPQFDDVAEAVNSCIKHVTDLPT
ncbi:hypothetical protein ACOMHN_044616 [Nucella lapillus]